MGPLLYSVALLGPDREEVRGPEGGQERLPLHRDRPRRDQTAQGTWSNQFLNRQEGTKRYSRGIAIEDEREELWRKKI